MAQTRLGNGALFSVGSPGVITDANITALDTRELALTTITLSFITVTDIPPDG